MARKGPEQVPFKGLSASLDPSLVPVGFFASMEGASVERGCLETGPRYGEVWSRPGAANGDAGRGICIAQFGLAAEYLAIVKHAGDSTCHAYAVSTSGSWTAIASGLPDTYWTFRQYDDRVYACAAGSGIWVHTIGWTSPTDLDAGNLLFDPLPQTFSGVVPEASLSIVRPAYPTRSWGLTDTLTTFDTVQSGYCQVDPDTGELIVRTGYSTSSRKVFTQTCVVTLPAALDLSGVDFLYFSLTPGNSGSYAVTGAQAGPEPNTGAVNPTVGLTSHTEQGLALTSDHTTTVTQDWADDQAFVPLSIYGQASGMKTVIADIRGVSPSVRNDVRRLILRVVVSWKGDSGEVRLSPLGIGGAGIYDWTAAAPEAPAIDYGVAFRNPTTGAVTNASKARLTANQAAGSVVDVSQRPAGAWAKAIIPTNSTLAAAGFTKVALYRSRSTSSGDVWHRIAETENEETTVELLDKVAAWDLASRATDPLVFAEVAAQFVADGIGLWKQHLLVFSDRKMYASWAGEPTRFLPPPEEDFEVPEEDDLTQGRTLYTAYDRAEPAIAAVEGDLLYLLGKLSTSVMVGDSMLGATPPRRMPGSRGILGYRACWGHGGGTLVGAMDGLWYLEASRAFSTGAENTYRVDELTEGVREAWFRLLRALVREGGIPDPEAFEVSFGGTGSEVVRTASTIHWSSPGGAASAAMPPNSRTHWLQIANLTPADPLPEDATITGINLVVRHHKSGSGIPVLDTIEIRLNGELKGTFTPNEPVPGVATDFVTPLDLEGLGITVEDIVAGRVSVRIADTYNASNLTTTVNLPLDTSGWVNTGVNLLPNQVASETATGGGVWDAPADGDGGDGGEIEPPPLPPPDGYPGGGTGGFSGHPCTPDGSPGWYYFPISGTPLANGRVPFSLVGCLAASDPGFGATNTLQLGTGPVLISSPSGGTIFIGFNDLEGAYNDNEGSFDVTISYPPGPVTVFIDSIEMAIEYTTPVEADPGAIDPSRLVVTAFEDEIWAFNGNRYLRFTRPLQDGNRAWEEGEFPQVDSVATASGYGARAMLGTGKIVRLWRDSTGIRYETNGGTAPRFSATTGWIPSTRRQLVAIWCRVVGTPTVTIETDDGPKGIQSQTIALSSDRHQPLRVGKGAGAVHRFTFSGLAGRDRFLDLYFTYEDADGDGQ